MLPKAHLTSDSGLSEWHEWVTTPLWLSGSLRPFLYTSSQNRTLVACFTPSHLEWYLPNSLIPTASDAGRALGGWWGSYTWGSCTREPASMRFWGAAEGRLPIRDTSMRMRARCRRLGNACRQVSSLWYPEVSSLYPVLSWCEKLFLAIFTRFSLFPFLISAVCVLPLNSEDS